MLRRIEKESSSVLMNQSRAFRGFCRGALLLLVAAAHGCASDDFECPVGSEGCPCTDGGACDEGLRCAPASKTCYPDGGSGATSSGGETSGATSSGSDTGGGESTGTEVPCNNSREGWCSCYQGAGAADWVNAEGAVDSCSGYSCCYVVETAEDTMGCHCSNDVSSCPPDTLASAVKVDSCPEGFSTAVGTGGGSGTIDYCADCLSTCSGLPSCCSGCGCICEEDCGRCF